MTVPLAVRGLELRAANEPVAPLELVHERRLQSVDFNLQDFGVVARRYRNSCCAAAYAIVIVDAAATAPVTARHVAGIPAGSSQEIDRLLRVGLVGVMRIPSIIATAGCGGGRGSRCFVPGVSTAVEPGVVVVMMTFAVAVDFG